MLYIHIHSTVLFLAFYADFPAQSQDSEPRPSETIVRGLTSIPVPYSAAGTPWMETPIPMVASHTEQGLRAWVVWEFWGSGGPFSQGVPISFTNQRYPWWWTNPNYRHINPISQKSTQLANQSNSLTSIMKPSKPVIHQHIWSYGGAGILQYRSRFVMHMFVFSGQFFVGVANFIKVSSTIVLWSQFRCSMYRSKLQTRYTAGICILYCTHLKVDGSTQKTKYP